MKHLSLFSGIGGLDLAAEMAGFRTVGQVEIDDYCNRVLEHHWPDVPRWRDVKDVTAETFEERTGIKPGTLAVLSGGFPCQPVSCAGKRKGDTDERWLWDEMLRVICEIRPRWVLAENVRGLLSARSLLDGRHLFGRVLRDLAENGYRVGWLCYGAGDVGAPHKRERVFIVANSQSTGNRRQQRSSGCGNDVCQEEIGAEIWGIADNRYSLRGQELSDPDNPGGRTSCCGQDVANPPQHLFNRPRQTGQAGRGEFTDGGDVANANNPGSRTPYGGTNENRQEEVKERGEQPQLRPCRFSQDVAYTPQHLFNRPRQTGQAGRGEFADGGAGPTQPRLGDFADGLPAGLAGHRWPAGWWPTPTASDPEGGVNKNVQFNGNSWYRENRHGVRWGIKLKDAIEGWPAGPGPQHPWEPPRIATGVKDRVNKLKALGNAVVPAQAYPVFRAIAEQMKLFEEATL